MTATSDLPWQEDYRIKQPAVERVGSYRWPLAMMFKKHCVWFIEKAHSLQIQSVTHQLILCGFYAISFLLIWDYLVSGCFTLTPNITFTHLWYIIYPLVVVYVIKSWWFGVPGIVCYSLFLTAGSILYPVLKKQLHLLFQTSFCQYCTRSLYLSQIPVKSK